MTLSIEECWHKLRTGKCITCAVQETVGCPHDGCDFPSGKCIWKCTADASD